MGLFKLNKKITVARRNGFLFNQTNKLTIKSCSNLSDIIICYYLNHRISMCHRFFFGKLSQNKDHIENICTDLNTPFHFACRQWFLYNNPQC